MIFNMTESPNHEEDIKSCKNLLKFISNDSENDYLVLNRYEIQRDGCTRPICVTLGDGERIY